MIRLIFFFFLTYQFTLGPNPQIKILYQCLRSGLLWARPRRPHVTIPSQDALEDSQLPRSHGRAESLAQCVGPSPEALSIRASALTVAPCDLGGRVSQPPRASVVKWGSRPYRLLGCGEGLERPRAHPSTRSRLVFLSLAPGGRAVPAARPSPSQCARARASGFEDEGIWRYLK